MSNRILLFFSLIFVSSVSVYSFYDIYGGLPFRYRAIFTGSIIISSEEFSYTNKNASFYFDYSVTPQSEFYVTGQVVVDWQFSKIHTRNLPSIVETLWNLSIQQQNISHIVKLENDQFLVFNKQGNRSSMGYFLENLFPIINLNGNPYRQGINTLAQGDNTLNITIQGGDYYTHGFDSYDTPSFFQVNELFVSKVYSRMSQFNASHDRALLWSQQMNAQQFTVYNKLNKEVDTLGIYFIDLRTNTLKHALLGVKLKTSIPYQFHNFRQDFDIVLDGHFDIDLISK